MMIIIVMMMMIRKCVGWWYHHSQLHSFNSRSHCRMPKCEARRDSLRAEPRTISKISIKIRKMENILELIEETSHISQASMNTPIVTFFKDIERWKWRTSSGSVRIRSVFGRRGDDLRGHVESQWQGHEHERSYHFSKCEFVWETICHWTWRIEHEVLFRFRHSIRFWKLKKILWSLHVLDLSEWSIKCWMWE